MMPDRPGVTVPPELQGTVLRAMVDYLARESRRAGGLPPATGTAAFLRQLDMSEVGPAFATVEAPSWLTAGEAARLAGTSARHVRRLASSGRLRARKRGWAWEIDADSARDYGRERRHGTADDDSRGTGDAGR